MSEFARVNKEKRNYIRMSLDAEIHCKIRGTNEEFTCACKNLSHTGIQFTCSKPLKEGTEADISIKINSSLGRPPLKATLVVKRVNEIEEGNYIISGKLFNVK